MYVCEGGGCKDTSTHLSWSSSVEEDFSTKKPPPRTARLPVMGVFPTWTFPPDKKRAPPELVALFAVSVESVTSKEPPTTAIAPPSGATFLLSWQPISFRVPADTYAAPPFSVAELSLK